MGEPLELFKAAKTEQQLAQEILAGGLNPDRWSRATNRPREPPPDAEDGEISGQLRILLTSAINSGDMKRLARAVALAWEAKFDGRILRQAEPKLVKKAAEIKLETELQAAIDSRSRMDLVDCLNRCTELGLTPYTFPIMATATKVDKELEEEARNMQDAARPSLNEKFQGVLGELGSKLFPDTEKLESEVEKEAVSAKDAFERNRKQLDESLAQLTVLKSRAVSTEKVEALKTLRETFRKINPRNLEEYVQNLTQEVEDLRADNAELMIAMQAGGSHIISVTGGSQSSVVASGGDAITSEHVAELKARIQELEDNEKLIRMEAAKMGAKWMEEKMNKEIEELKHSMEEQIQMARDEEKEAAKETIRKQVDDISKNEKRLKVVALQGLEESLTRRYNGEIERLRAENQRQSEELRLALQEAEKKISQLQKVIRMRG